RRLYFGLGHRIYRLSLSGRRCLAPGFQSAPPGFQHARWRFGFHRIISIPLTELTALSHAANPLETARLNVVWPKFTVTTDPELSVPAAKNGPVSALKLMPPVPDAGSAVGDPFQLPALRANHISLFAMSTSTAITSPFEALPRTDPD